jgi:hypothetical protein
MSKIKLKEWAAKNSLSYITANRLFHAGMVPGATQLDSGTILVEDDSPEQAMTVNSSNDAMSLFLKKTVEFSKNNSTVEDFAAYVISNFQLKIINVSENPKYSKQKPKPEDVQKHFQQFIPKGEKPKPNSFIMEPEAFEEIPGAKDSPPPLQSAVEFSLAVDPQNYISNSSTSAFTSTSVAGAMSPTESTVTQSVDLNSTPQSINYTGSNNLAFSGSSTSALNPLTVNVNSLMPNSTFSVTTQHYTGAEPASLYFNSMSTVEDYSGSIQVTDFIGSFQPTQKELESVKASSEVRLNQPRNKRGRKPNKK